MSIGTYLGRPIEYLTRQELLKVIEYLSERYKEDHSERNARAKSLGLVEMLKRREG